MTSTPDDIKLAGSLRTYIPKSFDSTFGQWNTRHCVLRGSDQDSYTLSIYCSEASFNKQADPDIVLPIKSVKDVQSLKRPNEFAIATIESDDDFYQNIPKEIVYKARDERDAGRWMVTLRRAVTVEKTRDYLNKLKFGPDSRLYRVLVDGTDLTELSGLAKTTCALCVTVEGIFLLSENYLINHWPFKYVRRYGSRVKENTFYFESGRRASLGDGMWSFDTPQCSEINQLVCDKIKKGKSIAGGEGGESAESTSKPVRIKQPILMKGKSAFDA